MGKRKLFYLKILIILNLYNNYASTECYGSLHMGHALTFTLQDILIRFNKKLGMNVLWQPGTDHAGIATEILVEKKLIATKKNKNDLGREEFLKQIWEWKEKSVIKLLISFKNLELPLIGHK